MTETRIETAEVIEQLKELVALHSVCYELFPHYELNGHTPIKVGFSLELYGTHDHGSSSLTPGCDKCMTTYKDLRRIAEWVLPKEERPTAYEIEPFDRAMHESPRRRLRPEVELNIKIVHRHNPVRPIDACEERCRGEMEQRLSAIGVTRGN